MMSDIKENVGEFSSSSLESLERGNSYSDSHYLLFGHPSSELYDGVFDVDGAKAFLNHFGIAENNYLTQARRFASKAKDFKLEQFTDTRCDFCAMPILGIEYQRLRDGRQRCNICSRSIVEGQENFEVLYRQVKFGMGEKFDIKIPSAITVKVVNQKKLSKALGKTFVPTSGHTGRTVGVAIHRNGKYTLLLENGAPRMPLISTLVHELTHIWQYQNWDAQAISARYGEMTQMVYEGMAQWVAIQYLFLIGETDFAEQELENEIHRDDIYGYGLRRFANEYPFSKGIVLEGDTPFMSIESPLS